jgi:hypothetical protein
MFDYYVPPLDVTQFAASAPCGAVRTIGIVPCWDLHEIGGCYIAGIRGRREQRR